ncbi:MAG TPA: CdaR family protein [Spirochaetia bacterium]|nr:CdaR family protein [Spirochaetia bacterium]
MTGRRFVRALLADLPVKVICLTAAVILLLLHRVTTLSERFVNVPLDVTTPSGLAVASAFPRTVRITLRGTEESILPILEDDLAASVSLESHKNAGLYREEVKVVRKGTALNVEPLEVTVEPQEITFTLEPFAERTVVVTPDIRGAPAYGYQLVQSVLSPPSVVIRGARSRVQAVTTLPTEVIDLTGRTGSFASKVKILAPNTLVRIAGEAAADFRATLQESTVSRTVEQVAMTPIDLSTHLALKSPPAPGSLQVSGTQLVVDGVRPDQLRLLLDCSGAKRAGQYLARIRPDATAVPNVIVMDWSPKEVTVDIVASGR